MKITLFFILSFISYSSSSTFLNKKDIPQDWTKLKKELKNRNNSLTSPIVKRRLQRIYSVMKKKDSEKKSIELIKKLEIIVKNRKFDLANLYYLRAQIYSSQDNFKKAFLFYNKAMDLKKLNKNKHLSILYDMARLHLFKNQIDKANVLTNKLIYLDEGQTPSIYILKAIILIEKKQNKKALTLVQKTIQSTKNPKQSWIYLGAILNIRLKKYIPAIQLLTQLTNSYPNTKKYWKLLSSMYLNINKDEKALATLDLSYKLHFLDQEQEILNLVGLLMSQNLYFKAAKLMKKSMDLKKVKLTQKNYEILGDCWIRSSENKKALKAYLKSSQYKNNGKIFSKIGRLFLQNRDWSKSVLNFKKALNNKKIKKPEQLYIWIGSALVNLKKYKQAITFFKKVINEKSKIQDIKTARYWINYTHSIIQ